MLNSYIDNYNFSKKNPIGLVPWQLDFLEELEKLTLGLGQKFSAKNGSSLNFSTNKQNIVLIFPHNRPKRYLENRYKLLAKKINKSIILPTILTESEFTKLCLSHWQKGQAPCEELQVLDRIDILYQSVIHIAKGLPKSAVLRRLIEEDKFFEEDSVKSNLFIANNLETSSLSFAKFFPYAFNLDRIFEECFNQQIEVIDINHAEGEVTDLAAALLSTLSSISQTYRANLTNSDFITKQASNKTEKNSFSTPAYINYQAAKFVQAHDSFINNSTQDFESETLLGLDQLSVSARNELFTNFMPEIFKDKILIFAGFVRLTASQENLFKYFWERGACFIWHSDGSLAEAINETHYSCNDHKMWLKDWQTKCILLSEAKKIKTKFNFLAGFDNHSQIRALMQDLENCLHSSDKKNRSSAEQLNSYINDDELAILLPNPQVLMPILHQLPEKNINISMGYPVNRTLLSQFIEILLNLQREKSKDIFKNQSQDSENYYWQNFLALLRHPYTKSLSTSDDELKSGINETFNSQWRELLYFLERKLKEGNSYLNLEEFLDLSLGDIENHDFSQELLDFCEDFIDCHVKNFENIRNLNQLGQSLEQLTVFLLKYDESLWINYPLDGEALVRLVENVIPILLENRLAKNDLPISAIFTIFKQIFEGERIPFEADPLSGMQILGMLESRLLHFKKVFIVDITDENLPGNAQQDPLLPDSLRKLLDLPTSHAKEILMAHTFYRLLAGAEEVWLYWQEGISSNLQEKSIRSRFVEEIIWNEELNMGKIISDHSEIIRSPKIHPTNYIKTSKKMIVCTSKIQNRLGQYLSSHLSATSLDSYLSCPAKFFYTYLAKLHEESTVSEGDNNMEFGFWFHNFLKNFYEEYLNKNFIHNEDSLNIVIEKYLEQFSYEKIHKFVAPENYYILKSVGQYHLRHYFREMNNINIMPLALEKEFLCEVKNPIIQENPLNISKLILKGVFDRLDERELEGVKYHLILDYKTGKKQEVKEKFWEDLDLWKNIFTANREKDFHNTKLLKTIGQKISSLQLPLYLHIYMQNNEINTNAAWVFLKEEKKEIPLINLDDNNFDLLDKIKRELFPELLTFCLNHLLNAQGFEAFANKNCVYCPHRNYC